MVDRDIKATYLIETSFPLEQAAEIMAGEQSCGTFIRTPGETHELREKHAAFVEAIQPLASVAEPSLPGARRIKDRQIQQAIVQLSWPYHNIGTNLAGLASTVAGNLFELAPFSGIKLMDLQVPEIYRNKYQGPQFGIEKTRKLIGVNNRPIIGTIIKPSVGLSPYETAIQTDTLIHAGLDFLKDDELQGDSPHSPFKERVDHVMSKVNAYANHTGKKPMYAFNITGDVDDMKLRHDYLVEKEGTAIMININWVGIAGVLAMARHTAVPIHGHRNGWGIYSRSPILGMAFKAYQKIWRLAGVDHLHTNGLRNKFCEDDRSVIQSIKDCLSDFIGLRKPMPVLSSGQWAGQAVDTHRAVQSSDLMYLCGGGIVSHPGGIAAGVKSVLQGWEAALQGEDLHGYATKHLELRQALDFYGQHVDHGEK